jgi:hypothetical protein
MRLQRLADSASAKLKLDMPGLDAAFRRDYINLVAASQRVAKIVVTRRSRRGCSPKNPRGTQESGRDEPLFYAVLDNR